MSFTVGEFKKFLDTLKDDTILTIYGLDDIPEIEDLEEWAYGSSWNYSPPTQPWTYVPTEEARSRGMKENHWPYRPAELELGQCHSCF